MSFRSIFLPIILLLVSGCAQEDEPYSNPPNLKLGGPGRQCLAETGVILQKYIEGKTTDHEISEFWECLNGALLTFSDYTKGRDGTHYESKEIRSFLARFFLGEVVVSDALLHQIMQVKRIFVGGSDNSFSRQEIEGTRNFIIDIKRLTVLLNPHVRVFNAALTGDKELQKKVDSVEFEQAMSAFHKVSQELAQMILKTNETYYFADLEEFLGELFLLIGYDNPEGPSAWLKYLPLLTKGKQILVGGNEIQIEGSEWRQVMSIFSYFVQTVSRLSFYVKDAEFGSYVSTVQMQRIYGDFDAVFTEALNIHPGNTIPFGLLEQFIDVADRLFKFPLGVDADQAKDILRAAVKKILTPNELHGKFIEGITFVHLQEARKEFYYWVRSQIYAWDIYRSSGPPPEPLLPAEKELFRAAFGGPWKMILTDKGALRIDWRKNTQYDLHSLTTLNWQRAVIRLLIRRFASDPERRENLTFLTKDELIVAQKAVEPLGVALGLFEPGDTSLALRIIREASLFMPRSDGDQTVTFEEGLEYLANILSAMSMQSLIFSELENLCPVYTEGDDLLMEASCFRKETGERLDLFMHHLPHMRSYFDVANSRELWRQFERLQEETIRDEGYSAHPIKKSDMLEMWMLLQYIDTFFGRFDSRNPKTTINVGDALDAYTIYSPYLAELLSPYPGLGSRERRALFTYLMKYGKVHFFDDAIGGGIRFVWWRLNERNWEFEADRLRIIQILASLSSIQKSVFGHGLLSHEPSKPPLK